MKTPMGTNTPNRNINPEPDASTSQKLEEYPQGSVFDTYIRNFNKRLRTLSRHCEDSLYRVEEKLASLEKQYLQDMEMLKAEIEKIPRQIDARIDAHFNGMPSSTEEDLQKMSTLINESARELKREVDELKRETGQVKEQIHRNQQTLREELTSETEQLDIAKLDRLRIADVFIELGTMLKEEKSFSELNDAMDGILNEE